LKKYSWFNCPENIKKQIEILINKTQKIFNGNLVGIYLHGSLAMGCFNPNRSDIDLLIVTMNPLGIDKKLEFAKMVLEISENPIPLELGVLKLSNFKPWKYPTPFEFHYSKDWREKFENEIKNGMWKTWNDNEKHDFDLAAHITVILHRGICLHGPKIEEIFEEIPFSDYLDSIIKDVIWTKEQNFEDKDPIYLILNYCRVLAAARARKILSKFEGGIWGLENLPKSFNSIINQALKVYTGESNNNEFSKKTLEEFIDYTLTSLDL